MHPLIGPALVTVGIMLCLTSVAAGRYMIPRGGHTPLTPAIAGYVAVLSGAIILAMQ